MTIKTVLVTGFEPFGGECTNPSYEAVKLLPDKIGQCNIIKMSLPVEYATCGAALRAAIEGHSPDAVICVGQAGGRVDMTVERVAINLAEARIADNAGFQPSGVPLVQGGPAAYFATIPVKAIVGAMQDGGVPASVSYTAGTFVCNAIMYELLHMLQSDYKETIGGFIHVPYSPDQAAKKRLASMPIDLIARGLEIAVSTLEQGKWDDEIVSGEIC